jgi:chromosome partitioning protein
MAKEHEKKTLIVDLDPQSNSSIWLLGADHWSLVNSEENYMKTSAALFYSRSNEELFITPYVNAVGNSLPRLSLVPASLRMLKLEQDILRFILTRRLNGKYRDGDEYFLFANAAATLRGRFDLVFVDCPPNLYFGTCNALCHSDYILIPCTPDTLSTSGLKQMITQMEKTIFPLVESRRLRAIPAVVGVALTKFKWTTNDHQSGVEIIETIISELRNGDCALVDNHTVVFRDQPIKERVIHSEAVQDNLPLCFYAPGSPAYGDVKALAQAVLTAIEGRQ